MRGFIVCFAFFFALVMASCAMNKVLIPIKEELVLPQDEGWLLIFSNHERIEMKLIFSQDDFLEHPNLRFTQKDVIKIRNLMEKVCCFLQGGTVQIYNTFFEGCDSENWVTCFAIYNKNDTLFYHGHGYSNDYLKSVLKAIKDGEYIH